MLYLFYLYLFFYLDQDHDHIINHDEAQSTVLALVLLVAHLTEDILGLDHAAIAILLLTTGGAGEELTPVAPCLIVVGTMAAG